MKIKPINKPLDLLELIDLKLIQVDMGVKFALKIDDKDLNKGLYKKHSIYPMFKQYVRLGKVGKVTSTIEKALLSAPLKPHKKNAVQLKNEVPWDAFMEMLDGVLGQTGVDILKFGYTKKLSTQGMPLTSEALTRHDHYVRLAAYQLAMARVFHDDAQTEQAWSYLTMASETVGQIIQMIFTLGHATCLDMVNGLNASFERVDGEKEKKSRSKGGKKRMEFFNIQRELVKSAYQYNTHWHAKKTNGKDGFMMSTDKVAQNILKTMPNLAIATTTIKDEINRIRGAEKS